MWYDSKRTVILSGKQYVQTNEKKEKGNQYRGSKTIGSSVRRSWEMLVTFGYRRGTQKPGKREMRGYFRFS